MEFEGIKKALEQVRDMCQAKPFCNTECPFYIINAKTYNDCFLGPIPECWVLDNIDIKEMGD